MILMNIFCFYELDSLLADLFWYYRSDTVLHYGVINTEKNTLLTHPYQYCTGDQVETDLPFCPLTVLYIVMSILTVIHNES